MRPTFLPVRLNLKGNKHNAVFLWNESWRSTDDFFYVWERNTFKPYYRNKVTDLHGNNIYPHYHYDSSSFKDYMNEFVESLPFTRVVIQGRTMHLIIDFGDEFWAYDSVADTIVYTLVPPKRSKVNDGNVERIKARFTEYILNNISQRVKFADAHLLHLNVLPGETE
jgi:hypothetical protein